MGNCTIVVQGWIGFGKHTRVIFPECRRSRRAIAKERCWRPERAERTNRLPLADRCHVRHYRFNILAYLSPGILCVRRRQAVDGC